MMDIASYSSLLRIPCSMTLVMLSNCFLLINISLVNFLSHMMQTLKVDLVNMLPSVSNLYILVTIQQFFFYKLHA
jgi:hypothetical protein